MPFDFNSVLKRTGEGVAKQQAASALGIPVVGFDPASLAISAGIVVGSWGISKILGSLFGDDTPPPVQTLDIQLAAEYPIPYRLGYHRYTGQLLYATATDNPDLVDWPDELNSRIQNVSGGARGRTDTEDPNVLDLVYHLSAGKIHNSTETPSLGGIYVGNDYVELTRLGGTATTDIYGARGRDRSDVAREQGIYYPYLYVTVYRGYDDAMGFSEVVSRSGGEWPAEATNANHSFAVVTLLDYQDTSLDAYPSPWSDRVPQIEFVGPGIELPDLSQYEPSSPDNPYTVTRYTNNLASVMYWVMTTWPEGPQFSHDQFDHRSVYSAYRRCADLVDNQLPGGYAQTEGIYPKKSRRYVYNGTIRAGERWDRILADLDAGWLGSIYPEDGFWRFRAGGNSPQRDEETLVLNAVDAVSPVRYITQPRREERFNVAHFTVPQSQPHSYKAAPPAIVKFPSAISREGGEEITRRLDLKGITDPLAAIRLGTDFLRLRNVRTLTANYVGADPDLRTLKPYEGVYLTDDKHNIENIPMIVEKKTINQDGSTALILKHDPADSFSDSQQLPVLTRIGQRGGRSNPPTNVRADLDYVDVRGQRALRGRITCTLDRGYDWIEVQWRKASETIGHAQTVRNDLRRNVRTPVVFIPAIIPNTDYLIAVRVGVSSHNTGSGWTEIAWNSGDDIRALPNPTGLQATGIIGGAYITFNPVDTDENPYYKRTEIKIFVGDETAPRFTAYEMGNDHFLGGLTTDEEHSLRIVARHETKSGVFSGPTTATATSLTAASAESGFLGLNAWGKQMKFNNFQSIAANVNANGRWGLSVANTWANIKNISATHTLRIYQAGTSGTDESAYLDTLEADDYVTFYLSELQNITASLVSITRNNVGTRTVPRYRYDLHMVAISSTLRENPVPVLASNTEITIRFSRAVEGADGEDGQGIEYIFCKNNTETLPTNQYPLDTWGYERGGTRNGKIWTDGAPSLDNTDTVLFRSERKVVGSPTVGAAIPATWSTPVVVGKIGVDGRAAQRGEDGRGVEYVFRTTTGNARPATPGNTRPYDQNNWNSDGWYDAAPTLSSINKTLWRSARLVPGLPTAGTARASTWGNWSTPVIVGRYGDPGAQGLAGRAGEDGSDGQGVEFRYLATSSASRPTLPPFSQRFDISGSTRAWYDAAPAINSRLPYRWQTQRRVPGTPSSTAVPSAAAGWGAWTEPRIVGRWGAGTPGARGPQGPQGIAGAAGNDGAGIEYIFANTIASGRPSAPSNSWGYDNPSSGWTDAAPTLSASRPVLWRAQRDIVGSPSRGASVADNWSSPVIVGRYGEDGQAGADGRDGVDGADGTDGEDGIGIEYVFARYPNPTLSFSKRPSNSWAYDSPGTSDNLQWHDGAPDLNRGFRYLYRCQRRVVASGSTFVRRDNWTAPEIVGHYGDVTRSLAGLSTGAFPGGDYIFAVGTDTTPINRIAMYGRANTNNVQFSNAGYWTPASSAQLAGTAAATLPPNGEGGGRLSSWSENRPAVTGNQRVWTVERFLIYLEGATDLAGRGAVRQDGLGYFYWFFPSSTAIGVPPRKI